MAISSEGGAPVATYAYDPWGAPLATTLVITCALDRAVAARQPFRYRGYTLDAETGLYYLPVRYYDPATARFLSPDPAPPSAGDPASLNPYVYCQDDPIGASDPSGAIMDADGDGKVSAVDCAEQMKRLSNGTKMANHWRQRAKDAWKAWKAQRAALEDRLARMAIAQARVAASLATRAYEEARDKWQDQRGGLICAQTASSQIANGCYALAAGIEVGTVAFGTPVAAVLLGVGIAAHCVTFATSALMVCSDYEAGQRGLCGEQLWAADLIPAGIALVAPMMPPGVASLAAGGIGTVSGCLAGYAAE